MNPRVIEVKYQSPHFLILTFTNKEKRRFSYKPYTVFPVYRKLENPVFAEQVYCTNGTVAWDDMTDFDPDTLYLESEAI
jgi:hypothetical protein